MRHLKRKHWIWFYGIGIGMLFLSVLTLPGLSRPLAMSILDVGQGDAILIRTPEYHNILIDAGPDSVVVDQLGGRLGYFDKTIDLFILTHAHRDHYGGILDVMQKYKIKKILLTGTHSSDPLYRAFLERVRLDGIEVFFNQNHQDFRVGPNLYLDILYPFAGHNLVGQDVSNENNASVVARLAQRTPGGLAPLALLTGDAEQEEEREILLAGQDVASTILKVGHHGSRTATSDVFLAAVNPTTAVVSAGEGNTFDHPHPETLEKLGDLDVRQTMEEGTIIISF
ncbi:MBL fold metallo-hydrolase [Patescibacteria group bacterium]|nr:MBL fold metallo-hydrolase [Patescibacteria group bacterium]